MDIPDRYTDQQVPVAHDQPSRSPAAAPDLRQCGILIHKDVPSQFGLSQIHRIPEDVKQAFAVAAGAWPRVTATNRSTAQVSVHARLPDVKPCAAGVPNSSASPRKLTREVVQSVTLLYALLNAADLLVPATGSATTTSCSVHMHVDSTARQVAVATGTSNISCGTTSRTTTDYPPSSNTARAPWPARRTPTEHDAPAHGRHVRGLRVMAPVPWPTAVDVCYAASAHDIRRARTTSNRNPEMVSMMQEKYDSSVGISVHRTGLRPPAGRHGCKLRAKEERSGKEMVWLRTGSVPALLRAAECAWQGHVPMGYNPDTGSFHHDLADIRKPTSQLEFTGGGLQFCARARGYSPFLVFNLPAERQEAEAVARAARAMGDEHMFAFTSRLIDLLAREKWLHVPPSRGGGEADATLPVAMPRYLRLAVGAGPAFIHALSIPDLDWDLPVRTLLLKLLAHARHR